MRSFSPGAVATIALWKSAPMSRMLTAVLKNKFIVSFIASFGRHTFVPCMFGDFRAVADGSVHDIVVKFEEINLKVQKVRKSSRSTFSHSCEQKSLIVTMFFSARMLNC